MNLPAITINGVISLRRFSEVHSSEAPLEFFMLRSEGE
jgi:hypothetical protein